MHLLEPPAWPWLLRHELRVLWRTVGLRSWVTWTLAALLFATIHVAGWGVAVSGLLDKLPASQPQFAILITVFTILLVQSAAFGLAVRALFERGDLDLLLASPVNASHVFAARGIAVACASVGALAFMVLPIANMGPVAHRWGTLAAYPTLAALGLGAAGIAFAVTLGLVRALGLRRAKVAAQFVGVAVGAVFLVVSQVPALLPRASRDTVVAWLKSPRLAEMTGSDSVLLLPWHAMMGDVASLLAFCVGGILIFAVVMRVAARGFVQAVQEAPAAAIPHTRAGDGKRRAFREGIARAVIRKELLLLARDPMLIGRTLLQVVYLIPLFVLMLRRAQPLDVLAAGLVVLTSSIAATLGWICVSGEEAPDLVGMAPVPVRRIRVLKVTAAAIPVAVLAMPFLAWGFLQSAYSGVVMTVFVAAAVASSAMVQVWSTPLGAGRELSARRSRDIWLRLVDNVASFGWAGACYGTLAVSPWALVGMLVGLSGPLTAAIVGRMRART